MLHVMQRVMVAQRVVIVQTHIIVVKEDGTTVRRVVVNVEIS